MCVFEYVLCIELPSSFIQSFFYSFNRHSLALNPAAVPVLGTRGMRKHETHFLPWGFSGKRPICAFGKPEFKPSLCLSLGSHEGHFTRFRALVSQIINEYKHLFSFCYKESGSRYSWFQERGRLAGTLWTGKTDCPFQGQIDCVLVAARE